MLFNGYDLCCCTSVFAYLLQGKRKIKKENISGTHRPQRHLKPRVGAPLNPSFAVLPTLIFARLSSFIFFALHFCNNCALHEIP